MLQKFCSLCRKNGEREEFWQGHKLRDENNKITCPILLEYTCPCCNEKGVHTKSYCPRSPNVGKRGQANYSKESCIGRKPGGGRKFGASRNYANNEPNRSFKDSNNNQESANNRSFKNNNNNNNNNDTINNVNERVNNGYTSQLFDSQDLASPFGTTELPAAASSARASLSLLPPPPPGDITDISPAIWSNVSNHASLNPEIATLSPEFTSHLKKFMLMTSRLMSPPARKEFLTNFGYDPAKVRLVESTAAVIREIILRQIGDDPDKMFLWQAMCP